MPDQIRFDSLTLCPDFRFIRVITDKGAFYDLVPKWRSRAHVFTLKQKFPHAIPVFRAHVPPCIFRDYTELNGPDIYREAVWKEGTDFYFPLTEEEKAFLSPALEECRL
jgi:hypothetical protein